MKKNHRYPNRSFLILTVVCAAIGWGAIISSDAGKPSPAAAQKNQEAGRLIIQRSAVLGTTVVGLSIDGVQTAKINYNGRYDAPLATGQHVLTVVPIPNREFAQPTQARVTVLPGKTYTFTAKRKDVAIVLQ
jgi:hypothetical protein